MSENKGGRGRVFAKKLLICSLHEEVDLVIYYSAITRGSFPT